MNTIIDINKKYRTRNGLPVKDLKVVKDTNFDYPIRGRIIHLSNEECKCCWTRKGKFFTSKEDEWDLIEVDNG